MVYLKEENNVFDNTNSVLMRLFKWRKQIGYIMLFSLIASIVFSSEWFITPKYNSTVIFYPTSSASVSRALLGKSPLGKDDILAIGMEEESEQMLQLLNSDEIRNRIIKEFSLFKHYGIDSISKYRNTKIANEYEDNIFFRRTEYLSIEISVYDKDAQVAADIANRITDLVDSVKNGMLRKRAIEGLKLVKNEYSSLETDIRLMTDSMKMIRNKGVYEYEKQAEVITEQLAIAISKNNKDAVTALQRKLDTLGKYGGDYVNLREKIGFYTEKLSDLKVNYQEAKIDAQNNLPHKFVVNKAVKADRITYPIRWIIVLISMLSTFILVFFVLLLAEKATKFKVLSYNKKR